MNLTEEEDFFTKNKFNWARYLKHCPLNDKKLKPLHKMDKIFRCIIFVSKMHWVDHFQHNNENATTLLTEKNSESEKKNYEEFIFY